MKKSKKNLLFALLIINLGLIYIFELKITYLQVFTIYIFLFLLFFLTDFLQFKFSNHKHPSPLLLLSINFLRILLCILFLFPTIFNHEKTDNSYIYNFFFIYFPVVFYDIFLKRKNIKK